MRALGQLAAILVCVLAAAALAVSQAFVIHDHVAKVHGRVTTLPPWPDWAQWTMAAGFEMAIVAVGLAVAITGFRGWLTVAELGLVAVSVLAGALVTHPGHIWPWVDTLSMSLVPLQYVAVILAAHSLHDHFAANGQTVAKEPRPARSWRSVVRWPWTWPQWSLVRWPWWPRSTVTTTPPVTMPTTPPVTTPPTATTPTVDDQSDQPDLPVATVPEAAATKPVAKDPAVATAIAAGVPRTTARRWSERGDPRLDEFRPRATANGRAG